MCLIQPLRATTATLPPTSITGSPVVDSVSRHKPCHGRARCADWLRFSNLQTYGTKTVRYPMALSAALTNSRAAGRSASTASASIQVSLSGYSTR